MNIEIRDNMVHIFGYVNAVERYSKPIKERIGTKIREYLEKIKAGVFRDALKRNDNVLVLLNHDANRVLASTSEGNALLEEDNIGLRADITITDAEVVEKARANKLSGWSFGFYKNAEDVTTDGKNEYRTVTDIDLVEVSILDDTKEPAYYGTSIESRGTDMKKLEIRAVGFNTREDPAEELPEAEESVTVDAEELANMIADIILAKMNAGETPAEEETSEETPAEDEQEMEENACGDDEEERSIDYSDFEERLKNLNK